MNGKPRCLYANTISGFIADTELSILGTMCDSFHGTVLTTTIDAWKAEIIILQKCLSTLEKKDGQIIFEYDIPRLVKRIDTGRVGYNDVAS